MAALWRIVGVALACACTRAPAPVPDPEGPAADRAAAMVEETDERTAAGRAALEVENNTTLDIRVFVLVGSMPTRLGVVSGLGTSTFELQPSFVGKEIRFYASPVGGSARTITDALSLRAGQVVELKLDDKLRSYRLSVY